MPRFPCAGAWTREAVWSIVADYRASAGIDVAHDLADRNAGRSLCMPLMHQDWGGVLGYDAASLWGAWVPDLAHMTVNTGHFMAEENPAAVVAAMRELMER
ncbi:hypothetical protein [Paenarthrobacter nitroguajacolicus]|uniref:hypothetical protein n=1 Tax=Paenarthrobacter nitroguajacolicus TaxID=211146 RepID=UPI002118FD19|nr:hypothetical protein [Paenarthrobacter nitroguajacolicus]